MNEHDVERRLADLGRATAGIRARAAFTDQVMLAALATPAPSFGADLLRSLRRVVPLAALAAAISVVWALSSQGQTDDAFAAADETVELEW